MSLSQTLEQIHLGATHITAIFKNASQVHFSSLYPPFFLSLFFFQYFLLKTFSTSYIDLLHLRSFLIIFHFWFSFSRRCGAGGLQSRDSQVAVRFICVLNFIHLRKRIQFHMSPRLLSHIPLILEFYLNFLSLFTFRCPHNLLHHRSCQWWRHSNPRSSSCLKED